MTVDNSLLDADLKARTDALDVSRSFIIQAPAGSGKTELLIQRYLALLAVVDSPEEVVAITFTRKAAAEMQLRVLTALRRAAEDELPDEAHERTTFELARNVLQRSGERRWNLQTNARRLRVLTLDALNASIARSQILREKGGGARVIVGAELKSCYEAAALATLDWLGEGGSTRNATVDVLTHVDNHTGLYSSYLSQLLASRDQWLPFIGSGSLSETDAAELRSRFEESLHIAVTDLLQTAQQRLQRLEYSELAGLLDFAATNITQEKGESHGSSCLCGLTDLPAATPERSDQWRALANIILTQKGEVRKQVTKLQGFPADDKARKLTMKSLLTEMQADAGLAEVLASLLTLPPVRYDDQQWRVLLALFRVLPVAVSELDRLFTERGIVDHIDVAIRAARALGTPEEPGDIALLLDYQIKHLLVDEMQDTSAAQYRLVETLIAGWQAGDGRSLCCVGDPMQSIYRFRNAEVGQFLLAQTVGIGQIPLERLTLRRNFRSGEHLVNWFNDVFPAVLSPTDDPMRSAVAYSSAVSVEKHHGLGSVNVHPVYESDTDAEARAGSDLIRATLADNPEDEVAVLVRGRTQLPQLLAALREAGVPYRAIEIDRLTDLPEIIEVLAITRAASQIADRIAWLGLLRSPCVGLDWTDLHALVGNDTGSSIWELLEDQERVNRLSAYGQDAVARSKPVLSELVRPRRAASLRDIVEKVWFALGGPGVLRDSFAIENVYRFLQLLSQLERAGTVVDVGALESILDLERVSNNDEARLQIMTMHRSKGLQFDHVLLYGLGRAPGSGNRALLSWFDLPAGHGEERKVISPVGARATPDNDPIHRFIELSESDKDKHEQGRLLYVACTRAMKSLHLMGHTTTDKDGSAVRAPRSNSLLFKLWPAIEVDFIEAYSGDLHEQPGSESGWSQPSLRRLQQPWTLPEPALLPGTQDDSPAEAQDNEVEFYWVGTEARVAGTIVHRWLQFVVNNSLDPTTMAQGEFDAVTKRWLREEGMSEDSHESICQRVERAVLDTLEDSSGKWILHGEGHTELALSGMHDGEVASVVLDRVRIDDNGVHWIVDYKTSSHEGGNLAGFLQVEVDRYRPQLERYSSIYSNWADVTPRCALYFPLLKKFVEVELGQSD